MKTMKLMTFVVAGMICTGAAQAQSVPAPNMNVEVAESLVADLLAEQNAAYGEDIIQRLGSMAVANPQDQDLQSIVVRGLITDLLHEGNAYYGEYEDSVIARVVEKDGMESLQTAAVQGIMRDVSRSAHVDYCETAIERVAEIAETSSSAQVKNSAVQLLLAEMRANNNAYYSEYIQSVVAQIMKSCGANGGQACAAAQ